MRSSALTAFALVLSVSPSYATCYDVSFGQEVESIFSPIPAEHTEFIPCVSCNQPPIPLPPRNMMATWITIGAPPPVIVTPPVEPPPYVVPPYVPPYTPPYTPPPVISTPVPEPSTWAMMLIGFIGLGYATMRKYRVYPIQVRSTSSLGVDAEASASSTTTSK